MMLLDNRRTGDTTSTRDAGVPVVTTLEKPTARDNSAEYKPLPSEQLATAT